MARKKFKPSPRFHEVVAEAALGTRPGRGGPSAVAVSRGSGRRRNTIESIAEEIIREAKRIVDSETGLPSITTGGGRNINYDFRSVDRRGGTYRSSFKTKIVVRNRRTILVVFNDHQHAQDVEFGTGSGVESNSRADHGYFKLPITERAYRAFLRNAKLKRKGHRRNDAERVAHNLMQRGRYYAKRERLLEKLDKPDGRSTEKSRSESAEKAANIRRRINKKKGTEALRVYEGLRAKYAAERGANNKRKFVGRDLATNKPVLFSRTFKRYDGYAILQRAVREVSARRF